MKKMDELYPVEPEEEANGGETLAKRYGGFMKKDAEVGVDRITINQFFKPGHLSLFLLPPKVLLHSWGVIF